MGVTADLGRRSGRSLERTDECWGHWAVVEAVGLERKQEWELAERAAGRLRAAPAAGGYWESCGRCWV